MRHHLLRQKATTQVSFGMSLVGMKFFTKTILYTLLALSFMVIPTIVSAGVISKPVVSLGLIGQWNFEDTIGSSTLVDSSGYGNSGTMTNMNTTDDYVAGHIGSSTGLDFDGSDDYISIPDYTEV